MATKLKTPLQYKLLYWLVKPFGISVVVHRNLVHAKWMIAFIKPRRKK